jgi:hypothetical protein
MRDSVTIFVTRTLLIRIVRESRSGIGVVNPHLETRRRARASPLRLSGCFTITFASEVL